MPRPRCFATTRATSTSSCRWSATRRRRRAIDMFRGNGPERGVEPLGEVLARLIAARGWGRRQARRHLEEAWAMALGPEQLSHTRVLGLRRGVLEVEVNNPVLLQELASYHKRKLLVKLRECLPNQTLTDLRFKNGTW